ncbi:MAG: sulfatase, partial [Planctomycetes bacterium]|nr:sulfatase [Planctomycetota bacterium]
NALDDLSEKLLFSPTRPKEELYRWQEDIWQIRNLADDPGHRDRLVEMRRQLDEWIFRTNDKGPESDTMYDSDMKVYLGRGNPEVEENIALMKQWANEGK